MSEYQYYEFRAIDRPLSDKQMTQLRKVSSRGEITPSSYVNVYNYGDFRGNPKKWMEQYFDAFVYVANWGTHWLMLRVPAAFLDEALVRTYVGGDHFELWRSGEHLILSFEFNDEEGGEWEDGEGWLSSMMPLREDLIRGDFRCLYLAWLLNARWFGPLDDDEELDDDEDKLLRAEEPQVPPGLGELNAPLTSFVEFLRIDEDLIAAVAEQSPPMRDTSISKKEIDRWVSELTIEEKDAILLQLIDGDAPTPGLELRRRMERELRQAEESDGASIPQPRTLGQLLARGDELRRERRRKEAERRARAKARKARAAAEKRRKHLESLVGQDERLWKEVGELIGTRLPKSYDRAVELLSDLKGLAEMAGVQDDFEQRMDALSVEHARKKTLIRRLEAAKLL